VPDPASADTTLAEVESGESSDDVGLVIAVISKFILAMVVFSALFSYLVYRESKRKETEIVSQEMKNRTKGSQVVIHNRSQDRKANKRSAAEILRACNLQVVSYNIVAHNLWAFGPKALVQLLNFRRHCQCH
jgi:mannitol-specific phosphotransferase system IIBC component